MSAAPDAPRGPPGADTADAVGWIALGLATVALSWTMDRLENQDVPPFAAPGLLPGLLGLALLGMGGLLLLRSLRRRRPAGPPDRLLGPDPGRALGTMGLCVLFGGVLVGRGLPFSLAAASFVAAAILFLRRGPGGAFQLGPRSLAFAVLVGLGAGVGVTALFQRLFLVRLP